MSLSELWGLKNRIVRFCKHCRFLQGEMDFQINWNKLDACMVPAGLETVIISQMTFRQSIH